MPIIVILKAPDVWACYKNEVSTYVIAVILLHTSFSTGQQ
jgi:hypothetical protein